LYGAFGRGDIDTIVAGCLPEVNWVSGGRKEDYPPFGARKGTDAVRDFFHSVAEVQDFSEFSPKDFYADRDKVFVLGRYAMTVVDYSSAPGELSTAIEEASKTLIHFKAAWTWDDSSLRPGCKSLALMPRRRGN